MTAASPSASLCTLWQTARLNPGVCIKAWHEGGLFPSTDQTFSLELPRKAVLRAVPRSRHPVTCQCFPLGRAGNLDVNKRP